MRQFGAIPHLQPIKVPLYSCLNCLLRLAPPSKNIKIEIRIADSSQYFPALYTSYDIEIISQILELGMRFPTPSKLSKSVYLRKSYDQKKRFRHVLRAELGGKRQALSLAPLDPGTSKHRNFFAAIPRAIYFI